MHDRAAENPYRLKFRCKFLGVLAAHRHRQMYSLTQQSPGTVLIRQNPQLSSVLLEVFWEWEIWKLTKLSGKMKFKAIIGLIKKQLIQFVRSRIKEAKLSGNSAVVFSKEDDRSLLGSMLCLATAHHPADAKDTETTVVQSLASTLAHSVVAYSPGRQL
nr:hypothetical protein Iba_chr09eCG11920 [Ipomoea batatas]